MSPVEGAERAEGQREAEPTDAVDPSGGGHTPLAVAAAAGQLGHAAPAPAPAPATAVHQLHRQTGHVVPLLPARTDRHTDTPSRSVIDSQKDMHVLQLLIGHITFVIPTGAVYVLSVLRWGLLHRTGPAPQGGGDSWGSPPVASRARLQNLQERAFGGKR